MRSGSLALAPLARQTIELRMAKPLKAEWLRISLYKTETLPKEGASSLAASDAEG